MIKTDDSQPERDPFNCTCGPCKTYWKESFGRDGAKLLVLPPLTRASKTSIILQGPQCDKNHPGTINIGDRVIVLGERQGKVRYVGPLDDSSVSPEIYVGVQLDDNIGSVHNGVYNSKRYFHCPRGHGAFVPYTEVRRVYPPEKRPPLEGNEMFPSYPKVVAERKAKSQDQLDLVRTPLSTPRLESGTHDKRGGRKPRTFIFDEYDVAVQDSYRKEQQKRERHLAAVRAYHARKEAAMQQTMERWREHVGDDTRAEILVNTLHKLQQAHEEGLRLKLREESKVHAASSMEDEDDEDDEEGMELDADGRPKTRTYVDDYDGGRTSLMGRKSVTIKV